MLTVEIIGSGELREVERLEGSNWRWLGNGDCEYTFDDGAIGIVLKDTEADAKKLGNWLDSIKPDPNGKTGIETMIDAFS